MGIDWRRLLKDGGSRREAELLFRYRPGSLRHESSPRLPLGSPVAAPLWALPYPWTLAIQLSRYLSVLCKAENGLLAETRPSGHQT